jgi:hypothetical protein
MPGQTGLFWFNIRAAEKDVSDIFHRLPCAFAETKFQNLIVSDRIAFYPDCSAAELVNMRSDQIIG